MSEPQRWGCPALPGPWGLAHLAQSRNPEYVSSLMPRCSDWRRVLTTARGTQVSVRPQPGPTPQPCPAPSWAPTVTGVDGHGSRAPSHAAGQEGLVERRLLPRCWPAQHNNSGVLLSPTFPLIILHGYRNAAINFGLGILTLSKSAVN